VCAGFGSLDLDSFVHVVRMTYSTATVADVTAFRGRDFSLGEFRRAVFGTFFVGIGSVAAVGAMIGCVTLAAAWAIAGLHSGNSDFKVRRPFALGTAAVTRLETSRFEKTYREMARDMAKAVEVSAAVRALVPPAPVQAVKLIIFRAPPQTVAMQSGAPPNAAPDRSAMTPLPSPRPVVAQQAAPQRQLTRVASAQAAPEITGSVPVQSTSIFGNALRRLLAPQAPQNESALLATVDTHTAVYDIEAHVVYLPNGERMEAHSGLGQWIDDPGHVNMKARGATPPNVYNLVMREGLFHGVEALRLTPVGDTSMYGRDGILAHPYMLGPSGQSFGCVSFKDYEEFLRAFKRGEVNRIVVVPHLDGRLPASVHAGRDGANRYAFN
jgi:Protein of unknown function (DUF2778)